MTPSVSAIPGGSGAPQDSGITTRASAQVSMTVTYDNNDPNNGGDGECHVTVTRSGSVDGDLPVAKYDWYIPGRSGDEYGPVFEHNLETDEYTIDQFNYFGPYEAESGIKLSVVDPVTVPPNVDEAYASATTGDTLKCGPDVEGIGDPVDTIEGFDPQNVQSVPPGPNGTDLEEAKQTLCLQVTLPFCG